MGQLEKAGIPALPDTGGRMVPEAEERHSPQDTILRREPPLADLFNLVAVHPSPWFAGEDPVYLIAVANVD
jgi:hypothetical protein